jgi:SAM-dependent MidA family methyltransferase
VTLETLILRMIAAQGPLRLDRYVQLCLHHPELGFYRRGTPLGAEGAFTTAPEISQMFGELTGAWCHAVWAGMGAPERVELVELGPGRGTMMADMLRTARGDPDFQRALHVTLIEPSAVLADQQRRRLADAGAEAGVEMTWRETWPDEGWRAPIIALANEVFDCFPVRQFVREDGVWKERHVGAADGRLVWTLLRSNGLDREVAGLEPHPGALFLERAPEAELTFARICRAIAANGGALLAIDYGDAGGRAGSTLQALKQHRPHDPLCDPGEADVTAHVDFAALKAAAGPGVTVHGPVAQGAFLEALGIRHRAAKLRARATADQAQAIDSSLFRLTHDSAMGRLFQVMAACRTGSPPPPGFAAP